MSSNLRKIKVNSYHIFTRIVKWGYASLWVDSNRKISFSLSVTVEINNGIIDFGIVWAN